MRTATLALGPHMIETYVPDSLAAIQTDQERLNQYFGDPKSKIPSDKVACVALLLDYIRRTAATKEASRLPKAALAAR